VVDHGRGETYSVWARLGRAMSDAVATGLAVLAVALIAVALYFMTAGRLSVAGMSFLAASLVIYFRETRLQDDETPA
jgi:hypothetical protein